MSFSDQIQETIVLEILLLYRKNEICYHFEFRRVVNLAVRLLYLLKVPHLILDQARYSLEKLTEVHRWVSTSCTSSDFPFSINFLLLF